MLSASPHLLPRARPEFERLAASMPWLTREDGPALEVLAALSMRVDEGEEWRQAYEALLGELTPAPGSA
jgi:hypothetical protein